jgi:DNA polymerase III epsilon subunit-like protein
MSSSWDPPRLAERSSTQLAPPATRPQRFAVIDCETTGLYNADRVVEVAVVVLDASTG